MEFFILKNFLKKLDIKCNLFYYCDVFRINDGYIDYYILKKMKKLVLNINLITSLTSNICGSGISTFNGRRSEIGSNIDIMLT